MKVEILKVTCQWIGIVVGGIVGGGVWGILISAGIPGDPAFGTALFMGLGIAAYNWIHFEKRFPL